MDRRGLSRLLLRRPCPTRMAYVELGRFLRKRYRRSKGRIKRFIVHNLLHADDPPHRLALGFAIGVFITLTPTMGFQMALVVFFAWIFRANKVVGVPLVWITNPATMVPIYYPMYYVGKVLLGHESIGWEWWKELGRQPPTHGWWETAMFYWNKMMEIAAPLWLGCVLVGGALAVLSYFVVYYLVSAYRLRRWGQLVPPALNETPHPAPRGKRSKTQAA